MDSSNNFFYNIICFIKGAIAEQKAHPRLMIKEEPLSTPAEGESGLDTTKKTSTKPREKGPIFKVCGVAINARTMSLAIEELQALGQSVPVDESARKNWKFEVRTKNSGFDVEWGADEDTRLLIGIWEFGMGAWDKIREADPVLKEKIFLEGDKKPLFKNVATRADYLLRVLKKHQALVKSKQPKPKKKREAKVKKEDGGVSSTTDGVSSTTHGNENGAAAKKDGKKGKQKTKSKREPKKKKDAGPMHFAAQAEPTPIAFLGEMDPVIFNECKEKMRPVSK